MALDTPSLQLVRHSFAALRPRGAGVGQRFYDRLFARHPALRPLFGHDLAQQSHRLMAMLSAAVALADQPARLAPALHELGERHRGYGVTAAHYAAVGEALLDTLAAELGPAWDLPTQQAWAALYAEVAAAMQAGGSARLGA